MRSSNPIRDTSPDHLILLDLIILYILILAEECELRSSLLRTHFSASCRHFIPLRSKYPSHHHILKHSKSIRILRALTMVHNTQNHWV
jgi:hypothetical protein